jgi:GTP-binding protein
VIAINKWDLVADRPGKLKELRETAERLLPQIRGCRVVPVSGLAPSGLDAMMAAIFETAEVWNTRVATAKLNRWLEAAVTEHPPPAVSGRRIKLRYITQAKARPPHFALFGNQLAKLPESYIRYLVNSLREHFVLPGVPIRLSLRQGENPYDKK